MRVRSGLTPLRSVAAAGVVAVLAAAGSAPASGQSPLANLVVKKQPIGDLLSAGGRWAVFGREAVAAPAGTDAVASGGGVPVLDSENEFVNDPCLDVSPFAAFPISFFDMVQSETEIAVLNDRISNPSFKRMIAGYNDSRGLTTNTGGISGWSFSLDSGETWIDGGGLPVRWPDTGPPPPGALANDLIAGDPVVAVDNARGIFYYASIYFAPQGYETISVSRGQFRRGADPQGVESVATTRCAGQPDLHQVPNPPSHLRERPIWGLPIPVVKPPFLGADNSDFLDKPWLYVEQGTGTLFVTYTRFTASGKTPIEVVVSHDQGSTWSPPRVIVPNLIDTFNQGTQPVTTPDGRLVVTWFSRTFDLVTGALLSMRIEGAYSDQEGILFSPVIKIADVNPEGEPKGYNRGRQIISNMPYLAVDKGLDDGVITPEESFRPGFGNLYVAYYDGNTPAPADFFGRAAQIMLSRSTDGGATWDPKVQVSDDHCSCTHVFPTVQADAEGDVYVSWIDRRRDPVQNVFNDVWATISEDLGETFIPNVRQNDILATSWFTRADAAPNEGDYNSSELINFDQFVIIWADGRFLPPGRSLVVRQHTLATPDVLFTQQHGLEVAD